MKPERTKYFIKRTRPQEHGGTTTQWFGRDKRGSDQWYAVKRYDWHLFNNAYMKAEEWAKRGNGWTYSIVSQSETEVRSGA